MRIPKPPAALVGLILFFVTCSGLWVKLNRAPPQWDDAWYLTNSFHMFDALGEVGLPAYASAYLHILRTKPPLITVLPTPFYLIFGRRLHAGYLVNLSFIPVLLILVYGIARRFAGERVGVIAAYIAGTMPLLYGLSHWFLVEYPLTVLICLTIYLVMEALDEARSRTLFFLGVTCGLGMLLKISFPLYVLLPVAYLLVRLVLESRWSVWSISAFLAPAVLLPAPWFLVNYREAIQRAVFSGFSSEASAAFGTGPVLSPSAIGAYLLNIVNAGASVYYVVLLAALMLFLALRRKLPMWYLRWSKSARVLLILWVVPFLVFLFGRNKDLRFVAPFLPALALVTASLMEQALALTTRSKIIATTVLLAFPLIAFLHASFGVLGDLRLGGGPFTFAARGLHFASIYDPQPGPQREILERIMQAAAIRTGDQKTVMIGTDLPAFNADNFELAATYYRLPLQCVSSAYEDNLPSLIAQLYSVAYFVYIDGGSGEHGYYNRYKKDLVAEVNAGGDAGGFSEIPFGLKLQEGGIIRIFEKKTATQRSIPIQTALIRAGTDQVTPYQFNFGGQIQLAGFALDRAGDSLSVRLKWKCLTAPDRNYRCFIHILDADGKLVGQLDHPLLEGGASILTLRPDDVVLESMEFRIPPDRRAGALHLRLGLFDPINGARLPVRLPGGAAGFSVADAGTAIVTPEQAGPK